MPVVLPHREAAGIANHISESRVLYSTGLSGEVCIP